MRNLRAFETVARTLSVTQAAKELHYAQSSVSDQIQSLERELGVQLLDRSQRQLRLTPQGQLLAEYTSQIFSLVEEARFAVSQPTAELTVGSLETIGLHLLPAALSSFRTTSPDTRVRVMHHSRGELYGAVRRGDMDVCLTFGSPPADPSLQSETLAEEPLVIIVPPAHPLASRGWAELAEFEDEPFLATEHGCGFRRMFDDVFAPKEPVAEVSSISVLGACVAAGLGSGLLPLVAVRSQAARGEVAVVESSGRPLQTRVIMTWLTRNSTNPNLISFQEALRKHLAGRPNRHLGGHRVTSEGTVDGSLGPGEDSGDIKDSADGRTIA